MDLATIVFFSGLFVYLVCGFIALMITIFGFKAIPRGDDAVIKSVIFLIAWIVVAPLLWAEILNDK